MPSMAREPQLFEKNITMPGALEKDCMLRCLVHAHYDLSLDHDECSVRPNIIM